MMSALEIVQATVDALNDRDFERMARYIADDAQINTFGGGEQTGKSAYLDIMRSLVTAIPDLRGSVTDVQEGPPDQVTLTFIMSGTNTGNLVVSGMKISPPTGRQVNLVLRQRKITVRDGQMISVESTLDPTIPTLLAQLEIDVPLHTDDHSNEKEH